MPFDLPPLPPARVEIHAPSEPKARDWSLVLAAVGIDHEIHRTPPELGEDGFWRPGRVGVLVAPDRADGALGSIRAYERENRDFPPRRVRDTLPFPPSLLLPIAFALLAVFFRVTGPSAGGSRWFEAGTSTSWSLAAEPWRAVTALTLHADAPHVLGNVLAGAVFTHALSRRLGPGAAALGIVTAGALGNLVNAAFHGAVLHQPHASIGASTAVFATVGLLAAAQLMRDRRDEAPQHRTWVQRVGPVVGAFSILGALGASNSGRTDLGAHLFGLLAGLGLGLPLAALFLRPGALARRSVLQPAVGALAVGVLVGSWQLALRA